MGLPESAPGGTRHFVKSAYSTVFIPPEVLALNVGPVFHQDSGYEIVLAGDRRLFAQHDALTA